MTISSENSNHPYNCTKYFAKIYPELVTFKNMLSTETDIIKNTVFTMHSIYRDYFNQIRKKEDDLENKFGISFATPTTTQTNDKSKKYLNNSAIHQLCMFLVKTLASPTRKMLREN